MRTTIALAAALLVAALPAAAQAQDAVIPIGQIQGEVGDGANGATHRSPLAPATGNGSSTLLYETRGV
jgi:opacity protein-like surface antigen